ncbi:MAG: cytochrome c oxidase assembly protein [Acidobacteriaceae bacterium]|jgi:cytochrome c oxidase assembly factor CtaG
MPDAERQIFTDWSLPIWLTLSILITAAVYVRGWMVIRKTRRAQFTDLRLMSFLGGLALLWIATASPLDGFADALLTVHMVEHLLLMSAIPMLLLYGLPVVPLLRGLPTPFTRTILGPLLRLRALRSFAHWLVTPAIAWLAMNLGYLGWHVPAAYDLALESEAWHGVEHLCFLITSLLFWWTILRPWPARPHPADWGSLLYLALSDIVMTMLSGFLTFCDRPVYPYYVNHPNPFGIPVLTDQVLGAVIMWVLGSFAFLVPAMAITIQLLSPSRERNASLYHH